MKYKIKIVGSNTGQMVQADSPEEAGSLFAASNELPVTGWLLLEDEDGHFVQFQIRNGGLVASAPPPVSPVPPPVPQPLNRCPDCGSANIARVRLNFIEATRLKLPTNTLFGYQRCQDCGRTWEKRASKGVLVGLMLLGVALFVAAFALNVGLRNEPGSRSLFMFLALMGVLVVIASIRGLVRTR